MISTSELRFFLQKLEIIERRFADRCGKDYFNIFSILRKDEDEVYLHSAFIFELLNPAGCHGMGYTFLNRFFHTVRIPLDLRGDGQKVIIAKEKRSEYGRIDIRLQTSEYFVVVENKILHHDENAQLRRYFDYARSLNYDEKHIYLIYLTLEGDIPSDESRCDIPVEKIICMSYKEHMIDWLKMCICDASLLPPLRETIVQYLALINKLTGRSMTDEHKNAVIDLLKEDENALLGSDILEAWPDMKWRTTWEFWNELEQKLKSLKGEYPTFGIWTNNYSYNEDYLNRIFFSQRGRDVEFGISAKLGLLSGSTSEELILSVGYCSGDKLYFGLRLLRKGKDDVSKESKYDDLASKVSNVLPKETRTEWWLGYKTFECHAIEFHQFTEKDTLALVNPQKRSKIISNIVVETERLLRACRVSEMLN